MTPIAATVKGVLARAPPAPSALLGAAAAVLGPTVFIFMLLQRQRRDQKNGHPGWTRLRNLRQFVVQEVLDDETNNGDGYAVLLGRFKWQGETERALVKLRPRSLPTSSASGPAASSKASLLSLLIYMTLKLQLESGAEYGYFTGSLSPATIWRAGASVDYDVEVIAPASERQIIRARPEDRFLVRETGEMYDRALGPMIRGLREDGRSIQWVYNILDHKKEVERIIYEDPDPRSGFILVSDPKWKSHPNPDMVPKSRWYRDPSVKQLACLAICHDRGVGSLRDLRARHLPMLENILHKGLQAIQEVYGLEPERVRVFVHYLPQFFHFHVHFSRLNLMYSVEAERAHLLSDIIDHLKADGNYYAKAAISYSVKRSEEAYRRLSEQGLYVAPDPEQ